MLRRFSYKIKKSGVINQAKGNQYQLQRETKRKKRAAALRRLALRKERTMQEKLGELKDPRMMRRR
ncbi:hypothetical protein M1534_01710 [Patescibacteria group bacterium]|nr:hypothetical protein [Patescibacteria group bacterium]